MTWAQVKTLLSVIVAWVWYQRENILTGANSHLTRTETLLDGVVDAGSPTKKILTDEARGYRGSLADLKTRGKKMLDAWRAEAGATVLSPNVRNGAIVDSLLLQRDINTYIDDTADERWTARAQTFAADPANATIGVLRRLTVDHKGQKIESGYNNETRYYKIVKDPSTGAGEHRALGQLYGKAAGIDSIDYRQGSGAKSAEIRQLNEKDTGKLSNATLLVQTTVTNGATVNASNPLRGPWTSTNVSGSPTVVVRTTNAWRSKTYGIAISGQTTTYKIAQLLTAIAADLYTPICYCVVVYWDGTWAGTITVRWGSKSQAYTSAGTFVSGAGFYYLTPTMDSNLYPINWVEDDADFEVEVATTSATGEVVLQQTGLACGKENATGAIKHQGHWYFTFCHTADATGNNTPASWVDSCTFAGKTQDVYAWLNDEAEWAYLPTSGTTLISDPA